MRHLRPTVWLPALLLLAGTAAPALADRDVVVNQESKSFPLEGARTLRLDVSVGELHVEIGEGTQIEAHLKLRCERGRGRCSERASRMTLVPTRMYFKGGRVKVAISLAKGKKAHDKRETIKRREADRETRAAVKERRAR